MDFEEKQKLQYLVFPEGILYNKKNRRVRTLKVNELFACIPPLKGDTAKNKNGNSRMNLEKPASVPKTGFEPARRFQRYHLKVVRLPISPPGRGSANMRLFF